jgi:hypothetical protein
MTSSSPALLSPAKDWTAHLGRALAMLLGVAVLFSLLRTIGKADDFQDLDFGAYHRAGGAAARGDPIYTIDKHGPTGSFVYAPAYAYFFAPLGALDYIWACRLWTLLNWTFAATCVLLALRLLDSGERGETGVVVGLVVLALGSYFWSNVRAGQVGALMAALCLGWAVCRRCGRPFAGGGLLAGAVALKLAPGLLVPYLIVRRDWRGLAGATVGGAALLAVPVPWVGWQGAVDLHVEWIRHCQSTQIASQTIRIENQSLLGALARLPAISNGQTCYSPDGLRTLERVYPPLVLVLAAALYGWIFWHGRRSQSEPTPEQERHRDNLYLALLMIFMTLAHPRAWGCNFVALTLAAALLANAVARRSPGWRVALGSLALLVIVCAAPKSTGPVADWSWVHWLHQGKDFWAALVVAEACAWTSARHIRCGQTKAESGVWACPLKPEETPMTAA